jgi:hypothetical protein
MRESFSRTSREQLGDKRNNLEAKGATSGEHKGQVNTGLSLCGRIRAYSFSQAHTFVTDSFLFSWYLFEARCLMARDGCRPIAQNVEY